MTRPRPFPVRLAIAGVASGLALSSCGGGGGDQAAEAGDGTLTVLHYYDEGAGALQDLLPVWEERFEAANPDTDVKFEYVPYDQMQQKVISAAAAGKGWDVIMPTGVWLPEMIKAGAVQPLDEYRDGYADKDQFPENTQGAGVYDGQQYAVQAHTNIEGILYNKTILDEIGAEVPTNLDEMEEAMAAAKAAGYNAFSTAAPPGTGGEFNLVPWLVSAGWTYEDACNPGAAEVMTRLEGWREEGYFSANDASGFNAEKNFTTGQYAFAEGGNWNLGTFETDLEFEWGVAVIEGFDAALLGGEIIAIGAEAEDPELAWTFIEETFLTAEGGADFASAGSVPLRADVAETEVVTGDVNLSAYAEIAGNSVGNPANENTAKISDAIGGAFNEFVAGQLSAEEAAGRICDEVAPLMEQ